MERPNACGVTAARRRRHPLNRRVLTLLQAHGWNVTSFQSLEPGYSYWFFDNQAFVAYVDTGHAWVAAGAPVAPTRMFTEVADAFVDAGLRQGRRVVFFATEARFVAQTALRSFVIGEQPTWNTETWNLTLCRVKSLRAQLRRARAKQVVVSRVEVREQQWLPMTQRQDLEQLITRWQTTKSLPPLGFVAAIHPFASFEFRRTYVAKHVERVIGLASVVPVYARNGWFIEHLLRCPDAPNGTAELLFDAVMRDAAAGDQHFVTLGLCPLFGPVNNWFKVARRLGELLYSFHGLHAFKSKLCPQVWSPVYLSFPRQQNAAWALYDSLVAFAQGGLLEFAMRALARSARRLRDHRVRR